MLKVCEELLAFQMNNNIQYLFEYLSPDSESISMIERTVSYRIAFPTFLLVSVFVATWTWFYELQKSFKRFNSIIKEQNIRNSIGNRI